jgi:predicted nuclease of restriction endonuclease-like (RecB) superfamily
MLSKKNEFDNADKNYQTLLNEIKLRVSTTRLRVAKFVTQEQMTLYWWLGERIVTSQAQYGWGEAVVEHISKDLKTFFPTATFGFSTRNLWDMRRLYLEYHAYPNLRQLVAEIPWGQNIVIFQKVKDVEARKYYLETTVQMGWTRDTLKFQIESQAYERHRIAAKQHNFTTALPAHLAEQANDAMKDVYMLDMLGIAQPVLEVELEARMVEKIKEVMLELGYGFSFIGNQYRIAHQGREYFIDLLFYNRRLRALVALEIKKGRFLPEYAGKMNFYLNLLDDFVREPQENPSIGIILCSERDHFEVEYALRGIEKPVGVSNFELTKKLPKELLDKLPDPQKLEKKLLQEMGILIDQQNT